MPTTKLEVYEAAQRERARELFEKVAEWEPETTFARLAGLLSQLRVALEGAGLRDHLKRMQSEVSDWYDPPAYFATIHLAQTGPITIDELAIVLTQECTRYVKPENGWPDKPTGEQLTREIDLEYVAAMQVHWLRMERELLGEYHEQRPSGKARGKRKGKRGRKPDVERTQAMVKCADEYGDKTAADRYDVTTSAISHARKRLSDADAKTPTKRRK